MTSLWHRWLWLGFVGPFTLLLLTLMVAPFFNVLSFSLSTYSPTEIAPSRFTLENYANLWDPYFLTLTLRTLAFAFATTGICLLLGGPLGYYLARARPAVVSIGLFFLVMPLMVSAVIRVFGWVVILGRRGLVYQMLAFLGIETRPRLLYTEAAVLIGLVTILLPFMVLPIMSAIERIPRFLEEAAANLGASRYKVFRLIIAPLSAPGVISGCVLVYTASVSAYVIPALMGGPRNRVIGSEIYDSVLVSHNWPRASAVSLVLMLLATVLLLLGLRASKRWRGREIRT
jgi:putative spermidine/putrescine transport system permease protein